MTVAQVKRDYGIRPVFIEQIEETLDQTAMPLYALVSGSYKHLSKWIISIEQATGSNSVDAYLKTDNPSGFHSTSETVKALFGKIKNFAYDDAIYLPVTITLDDNNYNNIKFSIRPTGEFFVGSYSRYSGVTSDSESKGGTAANSIIRSNPTVSAKLMQDVQSSIEDSDVNRKKNVSIEFKNNS
jgi:hypothetical protein